MGEKKIKNLTGFEIAIIGMAGRFPGAKNIDIFWKNLCSGQESITFFTREEMLSDGVDEQLINNPNHVNAGGILEDYDKFDAGFFKYTPREAELLNPQDRLFLEMTWWAFEDAGYDILKYKKPVGVFIGAFSNHYYLFSGQQEDCFDNENYWQKNMLSNSSFLPTRVSFYFNLTGPSIGIQTACSSSLVAVHAACQSLLSGECVMALAGGVAVNERQKTGYLYQENMILSSDGHCRAFDAKADGTVFGNGLGVVVLKRLEDAIKDGDRIDAIIKGSAVNNDGGFKTGYTAPSVHGQAKAVIAALKASDVDAETISYVEAHGTGTILGDPIEIEALTRAFQEFTKEKNFCLIGSLKTNIGHLDCAAGIAGLIKTALCLKHKIIPPSLHFEEPNPSIDFKNSPFVVNDRLTQWNCDDLPRRAGVSSLGIGGTNAHVILEEAPEMFSSKSKKNTWLICFSAKTEFSLNALMDTYLDFLLNHRETNIADLAYTLQIGRCGHEYRAVIICDNIDELIEILSNKSSNYLLTNKVPIRQRKFVFMFPGQGTQYANMGAYFYKLFPVYKNIIDQCANILLTIINLDIRDILYAQRKDNFDKESLLLTDNQCIQISLFVVEYALANLLISLNIHPNYLIGHSLGEYVAACLSGVLSIEDALYIVSLRGKLMHQQQPGEMLAILSPFDSIKSLLSGEISLSAVNTKNSCVVSGSIGEIENLREKLDERKIKNVPLKSSHAFHSRMMCPMLEEFTEGFNNIKLNSPQIPFISNKSGDWVSFDDVQEPNYWAEHIYKPVLFERGLNTILKENTELIFMEVGPGHVLTSFALNHESNSGCEAFYMLSNVEESNQAEKHFNLILGQLWLLGVDIDFSKYYPEEKRARLSLPTYQFERQRYWAGDSKSHTDVQEKNSASEEVDKPRTSELLSTDIIKENDIENEIARIWESIFGIDKIDVNDNFFRLGGSSLIAIQIVAQIKQRLNIDLPLTCIFTERSIHKLSKFIKNLVFSFPKEEKNNILDYDEGII